MIFKPAFTPTAYVLLGACSVFPSLTLADESLRLAESTITATRTEQAAAAVASVSTLTRQDIERNQSTNVPDLLRTLAGSVWSATAVAENPPRSHCVAPRTSTCWC